MTHFPAADGIQWSTEPLIPHPVKCAVAPSGAAWHEERAAAI